MITQLVLFETPIDLIALTKDTMDDTPASTGENPDASGVDSFQFQKELAKTPTVPQLVYDFLPDPLKDACTKFRNARERDVFLTGALSVLSGIFSNVKGCYDGKVVHSNLYSFTVAPPASDKNALTFAKSLGLSIHKNLIQTSRENLKAYLAKKQQKDSAAAEPNQGHLTKPQTKILFIPANSSAASVISHLEQCDERGIIVETEADTLANTFKQDWGGYSDLLRKAFHHEPISYSRKKENEFIEIYTPRLSIALAGTPSQVSGLIKSAADGLFSRFLFYAYSVKQEWRDVAAANSNNLTSYFENLGDPIKAIYELLEKFEFEFDLKKEHWNLLNDHFRMLLKQTDRLTGTDSPSSVKRLGLITYKIAMVLSILRNFKNNIPGEGLVCNDDDFGNAMLLGKIYFQHSLFMFESLQTGEGTSRDSSIPITKFYNSIKQDKLYKRSELQSIGQGLHHSERTVDTYIKKLVEKRLLHKTVNHGEFFKP